MVLVDPKRVELNHYEGIPHLLTPVVTSPRLAANVLANLIKEMEERYGVMSRAKTRSLVELNRVRVSQGERPLPYILCVIDELADLMMVAPADVEDSIIRLAQKSRAVGIHLVLATQRPSADVITGMIKANVPARIAFAVSSQTDSRVILDQNGAESLLGQGDMLFRPAGESRSARIQGAFITEEEIERLTDYWRRQGEPELQEELLEAVETDGRRGGGRGRLRPRSGRPAGRRDRHRGADGHRVDVDAPAPPAGGLHARGAPDRHDGAARRDLRLRGLQGPPGADHRGRPAARARSARRRGGHGVVGGRPAPLKKRREKPTPLCMWDEEFLESLVANVPGAIYRCAHASDWKMQFMSREIERITGYPAKEFIGNHARCYASVIHADDRDLVEEEVDACVARREPFVLEYRVIHRDGSSRWVHEQGRAVFGDDGEVAYLDGVIFDISERKRLEAELEQLAYNDPLTGLPNRAHFAEHVELALARCRRSGEELALLFLDLDDFKLVNDSFGHAVGDELLCEVARRLGEGTRETDIVARQGGDEFLVLMADLPAGSAEEAGVALAGRLREALSAPLYLQEAEVYVSASIGISVGGPAGRMPTSCSSARTSRCTAPSMPAATAGRWAARRPARRWPGCRWPGACGAPWTSTSSSCTTSRSWTWRAAACWAWRR